MTSYAPSKDGRRLVLIEALSGDCASLDIQFRDRVEQGNDFMCKSCRAIKPNAKDIGTVIVQGVIDDAPIGLIVSGLWLARREFLFSLGVEAVRQHFYVGEAVNYQGKRLDNWVTFHAKYRFPVRAGAEHASYRQCDLCGQIFYFATGERYLYPGPPEGVDIFGGAGAGAFFATPHMPMRVKAVVAARKWRKVRFTDLGILVSPRDGLGELPTRGAFG